MKFDVITSLKTPGAEIMAVDTNRLIVRLRDCRTQCVQLSDGALLWELEPDVPSPSAIIDGVALAMDHSNQLHAHDVHSGQQIWSQPIQQWRYWRYGPNLFVSSLAERELRIVGLHDGRVTQTLILPHERIFAVTEQVVIVSGMVERLEFFRNPVDPCCGVDLTTRRVLWEKMLLGEWMQSVNADAPRPHICGVQGNRVVTLGEGRVSVIDAATGELTPIPIDPRASNVIEHDDRFWIIRLGVRGMLCLDLNTGASVHLKTRGEQPLISGFFGRYVMVAVTKYLDFYHRDRGAQRVPFKHSAQWVLGHPPYLALQEPNGIRIVRIDDPLD